MANSECILVENREVKASTEVLNLPDLPSDIISQIIVAGLDSMDNMRMVNLLFTALYYFTIS